MSVVAYRDGVMAADSKAFGGSYQPSPGAKTKLYRLADGSRLGVVTAVLGMGERFAAWMNAGGDPAAWGTDKPDLRALLVRPDGSVFLADDSVYFSGPIETEFYAIGSGSHYAMGAMALGATAGLAVEVACRFDPHCGGPIRLESA